MEGFLGGFIKVIFIVVAVLMTFLILLQEGKGGGLAALGGTKAASVEGVTNPIRRATGYLAGIFFLLAVVLASMAQSAQSSMASEDGFYDKEEPAKAKKKDKDDDKKESGDAVPTIGGDVKVPVKTDEKKDDVKKDDVKKVDAKDATDAAKDVKGKADAVVKEGEAVKEAVKEEVKKASENIDEALKKASDTLKKIEEDAGKKVDDVKAPAK